MGKEAHAVGTKKSRQPKRQKSLELVQSRQSVPSSNEANTSNLAVYSVATHKWFLHNTNLGN